METVCRTAKVKALQERLLTAVKILKRIHQFRLSASGSDDMGKVICCSSVDDHIVMGSSQYDITAASVKRIDRTGPESSACI